MLFLDNLLVLFAIVNVIERISSAHDDWGGRRGGPDCCCPASRSMTRETRPDYLCSKGSKINVANTSEQVVLIHDDADDADD